MLLKQLLLLNNLQSYNSFREAASAMNLSESSIRFAIHSLEQELGCVLIATNKKGFHWTSIGLQVLEHANNLSHKTQELFRLQDLLTQAFSSKISVASNSQYGSLIFTEIITEILHDYPSAQFSLATLDNQNLLRLLISRQIDIALLQMHDIEEPLLSNTFYGQPLQIHELTQDYMCFLVGPLHPFYHKQKACLDDILQCSRLVSKDTINSLTKAFFQKHHYSDIILQVSNIIPQRKLIAKSNYISWQSFSSAKKSLQLYKDNLHILEIEDFTWKCTISCVCNVTTTLGEKILLEKLQQKFLSYNS